MLKIYNGMIKAVEAVMVALLSLDVLIILAQIIWRYVLRAPLGWTEQAARAGFIWLVMLGIPIMFNRNIWMSFDVILEKIQGKANTIIHVFLFILGMGFSVFYFFASLQLCIRTGSRMISGFPLPLNALYSAQPAGAALLFLVFTQKTIMLVARNREKAEKSITEASSQD
jgi:TRAP-type C4-dicarboxylate transport system permease small subunit